MPTSSARRSKKRASELISIKYDRHASRGGGGGIPRTWGDPTCGFSHSSRAPPRGQDVGGQGDGDVDVQVPNGCLLNEEPAAEAALVPEHLHRR